MSLTSLPVCCRIFVVLLHIHNKNKLGKVIHWVPTVENILAESLEYWLIICSTKRLCILIVCTLLGCCCSANGVARPLKRDGCLLIKTYLCCGSSNALHLIKMNARGSIRNTQVACEKRTPTVYGWRSGNTGDAHKCSRSRCFGLP